MAEVARNVVHMSKEPPDMDTSGAPSATPGEGGAAPKREKRKKKFDAGRVTRLFADFRYQYGSEWAWDVANRMCIKISHLRHTFGNDEVKLWLNSERRRVVMPEQVLFDPTMTCGPECVNLFAGLPLTPKEGNCQPVLDLLMHLCDDDEDAHAWILDWIAYMLQHPGSKLPSSVVMHGDEGSGKNLFWNSVLELFGEYGSVVGQSELDSQYNPWLSKKLFIVCDEVVTRQELRHAKGKLKSMISGETVQVNDKYVPLRQEKNHVNLVFLSNELQPLALDASDRRYLVIWTPPKRDRAFYQGVLANMRSGGVEALMHMLLQRDLSAFDPYAPPPVTKAKGDLIDLGRPNPERFWLAWKANELPAPMRPCSADQAYQLYRRWCMGEGEKYPMSKAVFGRMTQRLAGDGLVVRPASIRKVTTRVWLFPHETGAPPPEVGFSQWATEQVDFFQTYLKDGIGHES